MDSKKKITIWVLFLATTLLGITAIYIGYTMRNQPEIAPDPSDAKVAVYSCEQGGFIDNFAGSEINTVYWTPKTTMPIADSIITGNDGLKFIVTNPSSSDSNISSIQTSSIFSGNFSASTSDVSTISLDQATGPAATYSIFFVSSTGDEIFGVSKKSEYIDGNLVESVIGFVNNRDTDPTILDSGVSPIDMTIEREGDIVSAYIHSKGIGTVNIFSESAVSVIDGHIEHTLTTSAGVQSASLTISSFKMSCILEPVNDNTCVCEDDKVISAQNQCVDPLVAICDTSNDCSCKEDIAEVEATIIITSPSVTVPVTQEPTDSVVKDSFKITQEVTAACVDNTDESIATQNIVITNTSEYAILLDVEVNLDDKIEKIDLNSINNDGVYESTFGKIKWNAVGPISVDQSITLSFEMILPRDGDVQYSNLTSASEAKGEAIESEEIFKTDCLPMTALISDSADRFIIAVCLIVAGYMMFAGGIYKITGGIIWNIFGESIATKIFPAYTRQVNAEDKRNFEREISSSLD